MGTFCIKVRNATQSLGKGADQAAAREGRSPNELRSFSFKVINSPMGTTTPAGRAFLQIQAAFAEMERNLIRQRIKEGIVAPRARGRKGGRPRIMTVDKLRYAQHLTADRSRSIPAVCRELGDIPSRTL